jgi:uncharacterized membrane protein YraQ (UPF0718 family)
MKKLLRTYAWFIALIAADLVILAIAPRSGAKVFHLTFSNFLEMVKVLPPIFVLLGLLDVWVPRETIIKYMGEGSGVVGILLSILLGAAAAGPLYAAFPIAAVMAKKGAKYTNIIIFLTSWSTLKIPMFLFEMSALGAPFAIARLLIDIPGIMVIAFIMDRVIPAADKAEFYRKHREQGEGRG